MSINGTDKSSRLATCLQGAEHFMLSKQEAEQVIAQVRQGIDQHLMDVCREAELTPVEQQLFCKRLFNNPYAFEGYQDVLG
jgi:serine/threonine-protein kinase HipA